MEIFCDVITCIIDVMIKNKLQIENNNNKNTLFPMNYANAVWGCIFVTKLSCSVVLGKPNKTMNGNLNTSLVLKAQKENKKYLW